MVRMDSCAQTLLARFVFHENLPLSESSCPHQPKWLSPAQLLVVLQVALVAAFRKQGHSKQD